MLKKTVDLERLETDESALCTCEELVDEILEVGGIEGGLEVLNDLGREEAIELGLDIERNVGEQEGEVIVVVVV